MPKFIVTDCQGCWVYFKHVIEAADEDGALESYSDDGPTGETVMEVGDSIDGMDGSFNVEPATAESLSAFAAEGKAAMFDDMLEVLNGVSFAMGQPGDDLDFHGDHDDIAIKMTAEQCRYLRSIIAKAEAAKSAT